MFDPVWQYLKSDGFDTYRIRYARGQRVVIAKCAGRWSESARLSLCDQAAALSEINRLAGDQLADTVPRPILHLQEQRILLMSEVPGVSLERKLRSYANLLCGWWNVSRLEQMGHAVGTWLHTFHRATAGGVAVFNCQEYERVLQTNLSRSRALGIAEQALHRLRQLAVKQSSELEGTPMSMAAAHGDLLPQNVLIDKLRAGAVDFDSYAAHAPVYRDVSTLLGYVKLLASKTKYSGKALGVFADHFLSAYGGNLNLGLLRLFMVNAMLKVINEWPDRISEKDLRVAEELLSETPTPTIAGQVADSVPVPSSSQFIAARQRNDARKRAAGNQLARSFAAEVRISPGK